MKEAIFLPRDLIHTLALLYLRASLGFYGFLCAPNCSTQKAVSVKLENTTCISAGKQKRHVPSLRTCGHHKYDKSIHILQ